jgi:hypothetical protein
MTKPLLIGLLILVAAGAASAPRISAYLAVATAESAESAPPRRARANDPGAAHVDATGTARTRRPRAGETTLLVSAAPQARRARVNASITLQ